jgi:hypothetical protein
MRLSVVNAISPFPPYVTIVCHQAHEIQCGVSSVHHQCYGTLIFKKQTPICISIRLTDRRRRTIGEAKEECFRMDYINWWDTNYWRRVEMSEKQEETLNGITEKIYEVTRGLSDYWNTYSNAETWQFWVNLILFVAPLIILVFKLERSKAFQLGFYGLTIHLISTYIDLYATTHMMWDYPYKLFNFPSANFVLDGSLIPVAFIFVYQWTMTHKKNYYVYIGLLSVFFAFLIKPLFAYLNFFRLLESSYLQLFILYIIIGLVSKWITNLFKFAQSRS